MKESREQIRQRARALASAEREFWEGLVALRHEHGLTQAEVAERMGITQSAVARLERYDSNPTLSSIRRYALAVEARLSLEAYSDHLYASAVATAPVAEASASRRQLTGQAAERLDWSRSTASLSNA